MAYQNNDRKVRMLDFDVIQVGDRAELTHRLTREDVQAFASLTGDFNPLHVNEEFAKKTFFQKPVVDLTDAAGEHDGFYERPSLTAVIPQIE